MYIVYIGDSGRCVHLVYEVTIKYVNNEDDGTIILHGGGKIQVNHVEILGVNDGPVLIDILKRFTAWMNKHEVEEVTIKENE